MKRKRQSLGGCKNKCQFIIISLIAISSYLSAAKPLITRWGEKLDFIGMRVNKRPVVVYSGKTLHILPSDCLEIVDGYCNEDCHITNLNLIGYDNKGKNRLGEDRGIRICVNKDLDPTWAAGPEKNIYKIVADTGGRRHGFIKLEVLPVQVHYIDFLVNDRKVTKRVGERLTLSKSDSFSVKRVVVNSGSSQKIRHNFFTKKTYQDEKPQVRIRIKKYGEQNGLELPFVVFFYDDMPVAHVKVKLKQ